MNRRVVRLLAAGLVLVAASADVLATTILPSDFPEMVNECQLVIHGRVRDVQGELVGVRRAIESVVTVEVLTSIKGTVGEQVAFRVPGGRVGRYRRIMVGAPVFKTGDEVVLFLKGRSPALPAPYGLSQGVYRVSRVTGVPLVIPAPATAGVAGVVRGDPARAPVALTEFARQVLLADGNRR